MGLRASLPAGIREALDRGATVVTANQRAARVLQRGFDEAMHRQGRKSWQPAPILSVDAWTDGLWRRMLVDGLVDWILLNRSQEQAVWRAIIAADKDSTGLRSTAALAEMASAAWSLLARYSALGRLREIGVSTDTRAFQRWANAFDRRCRRDGLLAPSQLWQELEAALGRGELPMPEAGIVLMGFDQILPAQAAFLDALERAGYSVQRLKPDPPQSSRVVEAAGERDEIRLAATWARQRLEQDPEAQLAVVVPGMDARRAEIDRIFREVLSPELEDIAAEAEAGPYEFSLGRPLGEAAMGASALALLRWPMKPLDLEELSSLLLSPHFGGSPRLAEFDAFVLRATPMLRPEISLEWLSSIVEKDASLGELGARLRGMLRVTAQEGLASTRERSFGEWAEAFHRLLEVAGWPGRGALDSAGFQRLRRWESALDELATLDFDGSQVTSADALTAFERIMAQTIFAAESRDAPVQLMGPLEVAGQSFDGLWFLGAGDLSWPAPSSVSPLLPWQIQRELGMPGADPARERALAEAVTARILSAAGEVVFSYAAEVAEGRQKASPLLAGIVPEHAESTPDDRHPLAFETVSDTPLQSALPDGVFPGGAAVLAAQAACGFKAFAEHRLWSTEPEPREPGMDALTRGSLVHAVMEAFWTEVGDQAHLKALTTAQREILLDTCIRGALARITSRLHATSTWDLAYIALQKNRLQALLLPWLELEMARPEFLVRDRELQLKDIRVGPLRLNVRVDRVDETAGGLLIIDYKTGPASPNDWLSDRPDAPQLPLYAILADPGELGGVAFALLRAGDDLDLRGYATDETVLAKPSRMQVAGLAEQLDEWKRVLTRLAEDFAAGIADVEPKRYPTTCARCAQRMLCRLDVAALQNAPEDDVEGDLG